MKAGERRYTALMFDGSNVEGPYEVSSVFAAPQMHPLPGAEMERVWPVRMAYFPRGGGDAEPEFEVGALINAGGVAHRYEIDYGNFAVRAVLESYEELTPPDC
jgi:hypothetical protein